MELFAPRVGVNTPKYDTAANITLPDDFVCNAVERIGAKSSALGGMAGYVQPAAMQALLRMEFATWENEAWQPAFAEQHVYNENGELSNTIFQGWIGNSWLNNSQVVFEYDARGLNLSKIWQEAEGESWRSYRRQVNTWNVLGELTETVREDWLDGNWIASRRDLMSYENGLLVEEVLQSLVDMRWQSAFRYTQAYDGQGRQVYSQSEYYDDLASKWVANGRGAVDYGDTYTEFSSQLWDSDARDWFTYSRAYVELNVRGNPVLDTRSWRDLKSAWIFVERVVYTYNDAGLTSERLVQRFRDAEWQNHGLYESTYDIDGNLISQSWSSWDSDENVWRRSSRRTYTYQSAAIENGAVQSLVSVALYPQPARNYVLFDVTLGKEPTQLVVAVYDMLGREVARLRDDPQAVGRLQIDWQPGQLAAGIYLVRVQAGQHVETKKLVLAN
ncbi:MAG: T9SS type A sorting domain-containing protein [Bacteroidota bacterium]